MVMVNVLCCWGRGQGLGCASVGGHGLGYCTFRFAGILATVSSALHSAGVVAMVWATFRLLGSWAWFWLHFGQLMSWPGYGLDIECLSNNIAKNL